MERQRIVRFADTDYITITCECGASSQIKVMDLLHRIYESREDDR